MPAYEYTCPNPKCRWEGTRYGVPIDDRDEQTCDEALQTIRNAADVTGWSPEDPASSVYTHRCGTSLVRTEIVETLPGRVDYRFQTQAILADGSRIDGHFGVEAKKNKGRY